MEYVRQFHVAVAQVKLLLIQQAPISLPLWAWRFTR